MTYLTDEAAEVLASDMNRLDDLAKALGLQPDRAWVGMDLTKSEFVGTPERPIDLRGWNFTRCNLSGVRFEHVLVDETTIIDEADISGITGDGADEILRMASPGLVP